MFSKKLRASKRLRIFGGITLLAGSWLFFIIEWLIGNFPFNLAHSVVVGLVLGIGTWLGARFLSFKP
jgi:hypothetical protein